VRNIDKYMFLDDGADVKVYVELADDLAGVTSEAVESEFTFNTLLVKVQGAKDVHQLWVEKLMHDVIAAKCKTKITNQGKLVITLKKAYTGNSWGRLRSRP